MAILTAARPRPPAGGAEEASLRCSATSWRVTWLVLGLLLVSAFFRLYRLDTLPPGLFVDIGNNGLDIRNVLAGHFPLFFARNYGREALFIYFQALLVAGAGTQPIVFSFSAVCMGMLSIALSFRLFKAMFGWRTGLLAASLLAVSFWFVDLSRFGLRTMSLPPLLLATLYLLWRTLHGAGWRYSALAGVTLGLSLYTYIASRLLPFLVVLIWLAEWQRARKYWRQLLMLVLVSLVVFAPEGVYFWQHRDEMLLRGSDVSVFNPNPEVEGSHDTPIESVLNTAGMFFVRGDENVRHNIPHRPVFDPVLGAFFMAGLGLSLWQARREPRYRWPLLWLFMMCLPSALSHESPNSFRIVSVAPAVCFFPGLALAKLRDCMPWRRIAATTAGLIVAGSAVLTFFLYFGPHAQDPHLYWAYDGNLPSLSNFVASQTQPGQVYFGLDHRSSVEFLAPVSQTDRWYREESAAVPIPAQPADTIYISGPTATLATEGPRALLGLQRLPHTTAPDGTPDFLAFRWPRAAVADFLSHRQALDVSVGTDFELAGYEAVTSGGKPALDLFWRSQKAAGPYDLYVHLLDASGKQVAQSDRLVWPIDEGPAKDDLLLSQHVLDVPPGTYTAEIGAVHRAIKDRSQLVGPPIGVTRLPVTLP